MPSRQDGMEMDPNFNKGVVVAGAGPVGLTLALKILRAGIPVTVLEKRDTVNEQSKASTFHASTLDILDTLGVLESMRADGTQIDCVQYRRPSGEVLAQLDFSLLEGLVRHPIRLHYEQVALTRLMRDLFLAEGGRLLFGAGVTGVTQDAAGVVVTAADGSTHEGFALFGCDGAQSAVREAVRIGYVEKPYPGMVLRLYSKKSMRDYFPDLGGIVYLHEGEDTCSLLEMPDCWRIVVRVPAGLSEAEALSDAWVIGRLKGLLPIEEILPQLAGRDVYSARRRHALGASVGKVYIAGDALHLTNTKGGMNLNAGLHDAVAYAAAAIEVAASGDYTALDRAAWERGRVARDLLIPRTDTNVGTGSARVARIAGIAADPVQAVEFLAKQAMLDMLAGVPAGVVGQGDRANG